MSDWSDRYAPRDPPEDVAPPRRDSLTKRVSRAAFDRVDAAFSKNGPAFRQLALSWFTNVLGDTLVAVGLANTLFFDLPTAEARDKVALYLLLTIAPFAIVAPVLGGIFSKFPGATRGVMVAGSGLRPSGA